MKKRAKIWFFSNSHIFLTKLASTVNIIFQFTSFQIQNKKNPNQKQSRPQLTCITENKTNPPYHLVAELQYYLDQFLSYR